jgi:DNA-directed RNA polymerase specialized sigma24 family protein
LKSKKNNKETAEHYVDNKKFYTEMTKYATAVKIAKEQGKPKPPVNDYIGKCLWDIAEKLSHLHQFQKYPFRDELVSDAIINCIQYIDNFDPEKSTSPFSYFTQISWYAFLRRIEKEKKYLYTKFKSIENTEIFLGTSETQSGTEGGNNSMVKYSDGARENMNLFVEKFEASVEKKKKKVTKKKDDE